MNMNVDKRTLAAIGGVGLGTGVAYMLSRRRGHQRGNFLNRVRSGNWSRPDRTAGTWTPTSRFLAGIAGGALSYYGMRRPGLLGKALAATGMGLMTRGATNRETTKLFGVVPLVAGMRGR